MAPRSKPRVNHVRTGCLTCKRRRVKCPEEHPHCSRCIRGGFICAGYAIPVPWIFQSSFEAHAQSKAESAWLEASKIHQRMLLNPNSLARQSRSNTQKLSPTPVHSSLQLGNSDPFNAFAIPIGPHETHRLAVYNELVVPRMYHTGMLSIGDMKSFFADCLQDEASGYALFARNSAVEAFALGHHYATPSATFYTYMTRSCAVLRRRLPFMDGTETAQQVLPVMWAACLLGVAEMFIGLSTAEAHLRAMGKLMVRYIELMDRKPEVKPVLVMSFVDTIRACTMLSRPMIDTNTWFPLLFQDLWDSTGISRTNRKVSDSQPSVVHPDVDDKILENVIINRREESSSYRSPWQGRGLKGERTKSHWTAVFSQTIFQHSQLLHVILAALEELTNPHMSSEQTQSQSVRAYLSASLLLWIQITSSTPFTSNKIFDITSTMLRHVKRMLKKDMFIRNASRLPQKPYADARLWTLFIAVHAQLRKQETLISDQIHDEWFLQTFRTEAKARGIYSWKQAVPIFEHFLYDDKIEPHISQWWHKVVLEQSSAMIQQVENTTSDLANAKKIVWS